VDGVYFADNTLKYIRERTKVLREQIT